MKKFLIISYLVSSTTYGMQNNYHLNNSYFENYLSQITTQATTKLQQNIHKPISTKSWSNPLEALTSLGIIQDESQQKNINLSPYSPFQEEPTVQVTPEWYEYIDWNKTEPSTSEQSEKSQTIHKNHTSSIIQETQFNKSTDKSPKTKFLNYIFKHSHETDFAQKNPCLNRLRKAFYRRPYFTQFQYHEIFPTISNCTVSRDLAYGQKYHILKKIKRNKACVYVFTVSIHALQKE